MEQYRQQQEEEKNISLDIHKAVKIWNKLEEAERTRNIPDSRKKFPQEGYLVGDKIVAFSFSQKNSKKIQEGLDRAIERAEEEGSWLIDKFDEEYLKEYFNGIAAITIAESALDGEKRREVLIKMDGNREFQSGVIDSLITPNPNLIPANTEELNRNYDELTRAHQRLVIPVFSRPDLQQPAHYYEKILKEKPLRDFRKGEIKEIFKLVSKVEDFISDRELGY